MKTCPTEQAWLFAQRKKGLNFDFNERGNCVLCGEAGRCKGHRREVLREARRLYDASHPSTQGRLF